mmetsp:Transcript_11740/g.35415  ORF Transcript_11740/g.35415 Transcript_11740/m.35415 type:complete len:390 (+) Transcript_11740:1-1170(+)
MPIYLAMALTGLGLGASNLAGLTVLNARTRERRALAVGLATCGTSLGTVVLPPVYSAWIRVAGWRWSLGLSGVAAAVALGATAPAFWVPPIAKPPATVGPGEGVACGASAGAAARARAAMPPCRDARYMCWWLNMLFCMAGYFAPPTLLAQFAEEELGASAEARSAVYTVMGIGALSTRVILGCLTGLVGGPRRVHLASQVAVGVLTVVVPACRSVASLAVWSALYGLSLGPLISLISVILSELFGTDALPLYHGLSRLAVGIGAFFGPPAAGFMVDRAGYGVAFPLAGGLVLAAKIFLAALAQLQARHCKECSSGSSGQPRGADGHVAEPDNAEEVGGRPRGPDSDRGRAAPGHPGTAPDASVRAGMHVCCPLSFLHSWAPARGAAET